MKFILVLIFSLFSFYSQAMMAVNQKAIVIVEYQQQLYQLTRQETYNLESIDAFEDRLISPSKWVDIVQNGKSELAIALLEKLYYFLPNNEFTHYLTLGLSRNDDKLKNTVADSAYILAENFLTPNELLKIRTNPQYRLNLSTNVRWLSAFSHYGKKFDTLDQAVSYIRQDDNLIETRKRDNNKRSAMAMIAKSNDTDVLMELMSDSNFEIALASWYGLSRLVPEKVAYEIISEAIWRTDEVEYFMSSGCSVWDEKLSPSMAAYDLFSDYLSVKQLQEVMAQDPLFSEQDFSKYSLMLIQTEKMALALTKHSVPKRKIHEFDNFNRKTAIAKANQEELKSLFSGVDIDYMISDIDFTYNLYQFFVQKNINNTGFSNYSLIMTALKSKNNLAKKYLEFIISDQVSMSQQAKNAELLLSAYSIKGWPRDWQDLRNKAIEIYKTNPNKDSKNNYLTTDSKLLLN